MCTHPFRNFYWLLPAAVNNETGKNYKDLELECNFASTSHFWSWDFSGAGYLVDNDEP